MPPTKNKKEYDKCLRVATVRAARGELSLCPRGYCTARQQFEVYPSAYANAHASAVCKGRYPDHNGVKKTNVAYKRRSTSRKRRGVSGLQRWFNEEWVNICEPGNGPGGFARCGSGQGIARPEKYPYCRPYHRLPGTRVTATAQELTANERKEMCRRKRARAQGVNGNPTRVYVAKMRAEKRKAAANQKGTGLREHRVPLAVRKAAQLSLRLRKAGFQGGRETGWRRARQLATKKTVPIDTLATMRAWFARHGPDARNGGTSYPGYRRWVAAGRPMSAAHRNAHRGAMAWLLWGGDPSYRWLKSARIKGALQRAFPKRKGADSVIRVI